MHDLINSVPYKIIPLSLGIISLALVSWANWTKTKKSKGNLSLQKNINHLVKQISIYSKTKFKNLNRT